MSELLAKKELFCEPEAKARNRFICEFTDSTGLFIQKFVVCSIDRPKFEIETAPDRSRIYKWLPINVELYDPIIPSSAQAVWSHLKRNEYFSIVVKILGPVGDIVEEWKIVDATIKSVDFGNLDWRSEKNNCLVNVKMTVDYEYAELIF